MRLTVIGSSDAFNAAGRGHSCYWLDGLANAPIMVDFGATALRGLKRLGFDPRRLKGIVLTHLHGDHIGGLPYLFIDGMFNLRREDPLLILGPVGTAPRLETLFQNAYPELKACHYQVQELLPGETTDFFGAQVKGFAAVHMPLPDRPLILRLTGADGARVAFSGDTAMCDDLIEAQVAADLFVAECTGLHRPAGRHCTWEEWIPVLHKLTTKRMLLTHLTESVRHHKATIQEDTPAGMWLDLADDGQVIEL